MTLPDLALQNYRIRWHCPISARGTAKLGTTQLPYVALINFRTLQFQVWHCRFTVRGTAKVPYTWRYWSSFYRYTFCIGYHRVSKSQTYDWFEESTRGTGSISHILTTISVYTITPLSQYILSHHYLSIYYHTTISVYTITQLSQYMLSHNYLSIYYHTTISVYTITQLSQYIPHHYLSIYYHTTISVSHNYLSTTYSAAQRLDISFRDVTSTIHNYSNSSVGIDRLQIPSFMCTYTNWFWSEILYISPTTCTFLDINGA